MGAVSAAAGASVMAIDTGATHVVGHGGDAVERWSDHLHVQVRDQATAAGGLQHLGEPRRAALDRPRQHVAVRDGVEVETLLTMRAVGRSRWM